MLKLLLPLMPLMFLSMWPYTTHTLIVMMIMVLFMTSPINSPFSMTQFMFTDNLSLPLIALTLWITMLMFLASNKTKQKNLSPSKFKLVILFLLIALIITFSANNLILFYISFEASLIPTLMLILMWGNNPERLQASMYMMMYTITASLPLLMGLMLMSVYQKSSTMIIPPINPSMHNMKLWWFMMMTAFLVKLPMYGLHLWLPKAHVEAPVSGSMILAGILLKMGGYGMLRMTSLFQGMNHSMATPLISMIMIGAPLASLACMRQADLKSLIAYSSVAHMGLMLAGLMTNSKWGWEGSLAMMLAHGLASSGLFAIANSIYEKTSTRSLFLTKGMQSIFPNMTFWWFLLAISNFGAPPSINLMSEILLIPSVMMMTNWTALTLSSMIILAAAYSLIMYTSTQHGTIPSYVNPLSLTSKSTHLTIMLHVTPIMALITKPQIITLWT